MAIDTALLWKDADTEANMGGDYSLVYKGRKQAHKCKYGHIYKLLLLNWIQSNMF